jgi:hypothetical protein
VLRTKFLFKPPYLLHSLGALLVMQPCEKAASLHRDLGCHHFRQPLLGCITAKGRVEIRDPYMNTKFVAVLAVLTAVTATVELAHGQAAPKASQADVQKLVDSIKCDKTKLAQFCDYAKLVKQGGTLAEKNENDPKLEALNQQMDEIATKIGPDFETIANSDMDDASIALLQNLAKTCA